MTDEIQIEFVAGPTTPDHLMHKVGTKTFPFKPEPYLPAPGWKGQIMGIPGTMLADGKFEIGYVDLRSETEKLIDGAEALNTAPKAGERIDEVLARQAKAQHLLIKAHAAMLRRMR